MKRSKHSLSHYRLTTMNMGELFPVAVKEVLPGDSFRHQTSVLIRVSPLVAPVMHPVHVMVHHWFVPTRILWDNWETFITGRDPNLVTPIITFNPSLSPNFMKLVNGFGCGVSTVNQMVSINSFAFRAYNLIYNEFYRDQDLSTAAPVRTGDTGDVGGDYFIRHGSWEKDYFTTCRPYPQQGTDTEVVKLTLSGEIPVKGIGIPSTNTNWPLANQNAVETSDTRNYTRARGVTESDPSYKLLIEGKADPSIRPNIRADLSQMPAGSVNMDINEWRRSMAMQKIREHRNRYGSRYRDMLAFLGITSSDARLQRPEYLGGGKQTISFSEVLSTADTTTAPIGEMAGHGIAALRTRPYKRFFEEHGYVISLMFVRPVSVYLDRVPRHFLRRDYEHYWQKELEMMGEQPVTNFEVYGDSTTPSGTFGYIPRYDEYRHAESFVSGEFRSLLDYWHLGRKFTAQPVLNGAFVQCDPSNRIYASAVNDQLYCMVSHRISARRLVSKRARN